MAKRKTDQLNSNEVMDTFVKKVNSVNLQISQIIGQLAHPVQNLKVINAALVDMAKPKGSLSEARDAIRRVSGSVTSLVDKIKKVDFSNVGAGGGGGGGGGGGDTGGGGRSSDDERSYFQMARFQRIVDIATQGFEKLNAAINVFVPAFDPVRMFTGLMGQASNALASIPSEIMSLESKLLGLGTSFELFQKDMAVQLDGLVGDRLKNVENLANILSQGFRGNNRGLLEVAAKMDLTGQKTSVLTNEFLKLSVVMQQGNGQMNNLANSLYDTSMKYSVKTDQLIQVLGKLQNLEVMSTLGFGGEFANNLKDLAAKYKMSEDQIIKLTNALTNPATFQQLAKADPAIIGLVKELERATDSSQFEDIFKDISFRLGAFAETLAGQARATGMPETVVAKQLFSMFGSELMTASQLTKVFSERMSEIDPQLQKELDATNSLTAAIAKLKTSVVPLVTSLVNFAQKVVDGNSIFILMAAAIGKYIGEIGVQIATFVSLQKQIKSTIATMKEEEQARRLKALQEVDPIMGGAPKLQAVGMFSLLGRSLLPILRFVPYIGIIASVLSFVPLISGLFGSKQEDIQTLKDIAKNTEKTVDVKDTMSQQNTLYSMMAKDLNYVLTSRASFDRQMIEALTNNRSAEALDKLVKLGVDQVQQLYTIGNNRTPRRP